MRQFLNSLYVTTQGAWLACDGQSVDVLEVEIKTERVSARHKPALHRIGQVDISAAAVGQHAVGVGLAGRGATAGTGETEAIVEPLGSIEIIAGQDGCQGA